jgi:hypothetical protein
VTRLSIHQALALAPKDVNVQSMAAEVYAVTDDQQEALDCLKSAVEGGYPRFELERNRELDGLRNDRRYREIMAAAPKPHWHSSAVSTHREAAGIIVHQGATAVLGSVQGRGIAFSMSATVRPRFVAICAILLMLVLFSPAWGKSSAGQDSTTTPKSAHTKKKASGPGKEIGKGGEDIGKGAAKGSVDLAKGTAGGVGNLVTGHPVNAAISTGKGVGEFGEHVGVGTAKGVAKIGKGVGGEVKKLDHKSEK